VNRIHDNSYYRELHFFSLFLPSGSCITGSQCRSGLWRSVEVIQPDADAATVAVVHRQLVHSASHVVEVLGGLV